MIVLVIVTGPMFVVLDESKLHLWLYFVASIVTHSTLKHWSPKYRQLLDVAKLATKTD